MDTTELKELYLSFFESRQHKRIASASLVPENDPSVLFTTAGMHPLVPFLLGHPHPLGKRLCDVQVCIRTGDINDVGDYSHLTFFEMLGNWSLGDYFKEDAISYSFEFLTKQLKLPVDKLAVSCFAGDKDATRDDEAAEIWRRQGIPQERIAYLPKEDNWWGPAGETGPCGPDSEMFYWTSSEPAPKAFDPKDKNWLEIWNDVFMQYNKNSDGSFTPLAQKNVDTGLGVERVTAVLNGKHSVYEIDQFQQLFALIRKLSRNPEERSMRIIADHIRASTFILGDHRHIAPSNVDQGYVLRRFIRRIIRHLRLINADLSGEPLTPQLAELVISLYKGQYPGLAEKRQFIHDELAKEELKFRKTLDNGLKNFEKLSSKSISADDAFLLYQSFGFPIEVTEELAKEKGISVDVAGFGELFKKHQELSRQGADKKFKGGLSDSSEMTTKLHTATHLLNEALRLVLSKDIKQKGSNITPERLRFDFNFDRKLTAGELKAVEDLVNKRISESLNVSRKEMSLEDAKAQGAQSEFGARYPDAVSIYSVGNFSKEICGGPHVANTSELGTFKIIKEEGVAQGIRRIKASLSS